MERGKKNHKIHKRRGYVSTEIWWIASTPPTHPTTSTKDAQLSISLRTDSVFCILNETRPVGDLFSVQNTHFFFLFLSTTLLSGWQYFSHSLYHKVKVRVGWEKDARWKHWQTECPVICWQAPTFTCVWCFMKVEGASISTAHQMCDYKVCQCNIHKGHSRFNPYLTLSGIWITEFKAI